MAIWIAFLRGINVGGNNMLPMKELVGVLEGSGCKNVRTYIQSGNVVFQSRKASRETLASNIANAVFKSHGFRPGVIVLSARHLQQAIDENPFADAQTEPKSLHLYFLATPPKCPNLQAMNEIKSPSESFVITDTALHLHAPDGIARSRLAAKVEKLLGVAVTARNWRTVGKVLELATHSH